MNHLGQDAELYALGMLDDDARARADDHLLTCAACSELVGQAEAAVAALVDATQQRRREPRPARWPFAVAAAFALAASGLLAQNVIMHGDLNADGMLFATLVNSHFDHTQFQAPNGTAIPAKAIYERHGKWYEIVVDGAPAWHLVAIGADGSRAPVATTFARRGVASIAFFDGSAPLRSLVLEDANGRVVGRVRPSLEADVGFTPAFATP